MLELKDVTKSFGALTVLDNVSVAFHPGETTVILGPSGSGKSTLLRCLNLLEVPQAGTLSVPDITVDFSRRVGRTAVSRARSHSSMVFQNFQLFPHLRVTENVTLGPISTGKANKEEARQTAQSLLEKVGLGDRGHSFPAQLSGGQQQRVAIARALAVKPKMMLFDEPTSALDPELRHEVLKVMQDLAEEGMTMVIVTHEIGFAEKVASRLIFIDKGRIAEDGNPQELIANPPSQRLQEFLQHVS